jgi:hypothetical protein
MNCITKSQKKESTPARHLPLMAENSPAGYQTTKIQNHKNENSTLLH